MSDCIIRVDGVGKRYTLGTTRKQKSRTLRDVIAGFGSSAGRIAKALVSGESRRDGETLWALDDVSFEVNRGEVIGIVGRNGAGKSTLLKILSRITEPSTGCIDLVGRVGSLLEVGTGFHPELSGRENIYLNGAILGMRRSEIDSKFDEIVDFAEVEKFIDTQVKHYSSGMYLRLAFAVAAHLEPEILLVDEVLAVGDASFQRKCLGKMGDLSGQGRTVLLISHNMAAIQALCQRAILLEHGRLTYSGDTQEVIRYYLDHQGVLGQAAVDLEAHPGRVTPSKDAVFTGIRLLNSAGQEALTFELEEQITFEIEVDMKDRVLNDPLMAMMIDRMGVNICALSTYLMVPDPVQLRDKMIIRCHWQPGTLAPGVYALARLSIKSSSRGDRLDTLEDVLTFEILPTDLYGTGRVEQKGTLLVPKGSWEFIPASLPSLVSSHG